MSKPSNGKPPRLDFSTMSEEDIVTHIQEHRDEEASLHLMTQYRPWIRTWARSYFLVGAEREDILQEGMIGLYKACRDYKRTSGVSFRTFAKVCVERQILTAIKAATRLKHGPLNSYLSLQKPVHDDGHSERQVLEVLEEEQVQSPEEVYMYRDAFEELEQQLMHLLTDLEWDVLHGYLQGSSYQEIAASTGREPKSIDNALQRIRKKIERYMATRQ